MRDEFFEEPTEQSLVKITIVRKYFEAWANVMARVAAPRDGRIGYFDLFCGPGRYQDGTPSTPIWVLTRAVEQPTLRRTLVTVFNDADRANVESLGREIGQIPGIDSLHHQPILLNLELGENSSITDLLARYRTIPTLFFADPWGYKGLSLELISRSVRSWGCEFILFFNYSRINRDLGRDDSPVVQRYLGELLGSERAGSLRIELGRRDLTAGERELLVIEQACEALKQSAGRYVLPFRFRNERGTRTSHYLIFVTKGFKGYEIMKETMARRSSSAAEGVPSFEYSPATFRQPLLFDLSRPLAELGDTLLATFAGMRLTLLEVYQRHSVGRGYVKRNYKDALARLEQEGRIAVDPPKAMRRKGTFPDRTVVEFPAKGGQ
jgi:three-Cys-motif partner protein